MEPEGMEKTSTIVLSALSLTNPLYSTFVEGVELMTVMSFGQVTSGGTKSNTITVTLQREDSPLTSVTVV